jgi:hypothetical protein
MARPGCAPSGATCSAWTRARPAHRRRARPPGLTARAAPQRRAASAPRARAPW